MLSREFRFSPQESTGVDGLLKRGLRLNPKSPKSMDLAELSAPDSFLVFVGRVSSLLCARADDVLGIGNLED